MGLNISSIVPASEKAKNVATEDYVDTLVGEIDVSEDIDSNNDIMAQRLGYENYNDMVNAAVSGNTIINGGYINTPLIQANAINAEQINTTGLIAEDVSANDFHGKNFYGGYFEGGLFVGAVLKASYLDLDGELEVLTNYHITVAMYNANPSLYTDAVYTEASNEYRIPSLSTVYEPVKTQSISSGGWFNGLIKAYDVANAGHNNKAVKIRPFLIVNTNTPILSGSINVTGVASYGPSNNLSGTTSFTIYIGSASFPFYFNHNTGGSWASGDDSNKYGGIATPTFVINGSSTSASNSYNISNEDTPPAMSASGSKTISALGFSFTLSYSIAQSGAWYNRYATAYYSISINTGANFTSADLVSASLIRIKCNSIGSGTSTRYGKTSTSLQVNNMA